MWNQPFDTYRGASGGSGLRALAPAVSRGKWLLLFFFTVATLNAALFAQRTSEEYVALRRYSLPASAVEIDSLQVLEQVYYRQGSPFSGISFERYPGGMLQRVMHLRDGVKHGPLYIWYPDGSPQMSAWYVQGRLRGRFLGWYANGNVIYDMVIGPGGYNGDFMQDDSRLSDDEPGNYEQEGNDNE